MGDPFIKEYPYTDKLAEKIISGEIYGRIVYRNDKFGDFYKYIEIYEY